MSVVTVIEVIGQSPDGWEEAAQEAIRTASRSLRGISSIYIKNFEAVVEDDRVTQYRVNAKISFRYEGGGGGGGQA
jgi:dodecin